MRPRKSKCVVRIDNDDYKSRKKKKKLKQIAEALDVQNFVDDLTITQKVRVNKSLIINMEKAGKVDIPKGAERNSYTPTHEYGIIYIPVNRLKMVYQTEKSIDHAKVNSIKEDIKNNKLLEPIEIGYNYDVIDGHHRWVASKELGYNHVPCRVVGNNSNKVRRAKLKYRKLWKGLEFPDLYTVLDLSKGMGGHHELHKDKLVKRRVMVRGNNGKTFFREQWVSLDKPIPGVQTPKPDEPTHTTFRHDEGDIKGMEKKQHAKFPITRMPTEDIKVAKYGYTPDEAGIKDALQKYHEGIPLPLVSVSPRGEVLNHPELVEMARRLGLTHVPTIVVGNPDLKKKIETKYKERVFEQDKDNDEKLVILGEPRTNSNVISLSTQLVNDVTNFEDFISKRYPHSYIMSQAEKQGIKWNTFQNNGARLPQNSAILWMRVSEAIKNNIKDSKPFEIAYDEGEMDKYSQVHGKGNQYKYFLSVFEKFGGKQQPLMEYLTKMKISWKHDEDPSINWMRAVAACKRELAKGKMIAGVRTRVKQEMTMANLLVNDQIKAKVTAFGKQYGKSAVMDRATELDIKFDKNDKHGNPLPQNSNILWMRAHTAIATHIALDHEFGIKGAVNANPQLKATVGGNKELGQWQKYALDWGARNTQKDESGTKVYAMSCLQLDRGIDENKAEELYNKMVANSRNANIMVMFDPDEMLSTGVSYLDQVCADGFLKNNITLGRGTIDKENLESNEMYLYDQEYSSQVKDADRPVYGVIDLFNTGLQANPMAGNVAFVMKKDANNRSTGSQYDSNEIPYGQEGKWTKSLTDPHQLLIDRWSSKWKKPNKANKQRARAMSSVIEGTTSMDDRSYFEAEMHGKMDIKKDVEHILVPKEWEHDKAHKKQNDRLQQAAKLFGVPIKYGD